MKGNRTVLYTLGSLEATWIFLARIRKNNEEHLLHYEDHVAHQ
jgi:hypothetical protein